MVNAATRILRYPKTGRGGPLRAPETDPSLRRAPGEFSVSAIWNLKTVNSHTFSTRILGKTNLPIWFLF